MKDKKHDILEQRMCKELEALEDKYRSGGELAEADLKRIDMLYHALKSKATYDAMKEASEYEYDEEGFSGHRGRAMNGRYVSRDPGPDWSGYYPRYPRW